MTNSGDTLLSDVFNQVAIQGIGDNPATARVMSLPTALACCKVKFPDGRFKAQGLFGQLIDIAPDDNVVILKLSAWPEGAVAEMVFESYC